MKINWGHGIFIFYCFFLVTVVVRIVASLGVDNSLVVDEYYKEDINFQSRLDKTHNSNTENILTYKHDENKKIFGLSFDTKSDVTGTVHFYRASDKSLDFTKVINARNQSFDLEGIQSGKWKLKIEWLINEVPYYKEINLFI